MSTKAFSIRADSEKIQRLDTLAEQMEQSRNDLVNQAINRLLELYTWQAERTRLTMRLRWTTLCQSVGWGVFKIYCQLSRHPVGVWVGGQLVVYRISIS